MKVAIISFSPLYATPYLQYYLDAINKTGNKCDIIFWDRDGDFSAPAEIPGIKYIPYRHKTSNSRIAKYTGYIFMVWFIRKILKTNSYDRVFFLQTHAAVACKKILLKNYKSRYIVDIRDFTLENFSWYRKLEKLVIENSYTTVISSNGYRKFLPQFNYTVVHNYTRIADDIKPVPALNKENIPIKISFIGNVRFIKMAKKMLLLMKNDDRFHLNFVGKGSKNLQRFCIENKIYNVTLVGRFSPEETVDFYRDCSIVNNYYGNKSRYLDYALSNKLYYAALFHIPVLVNPNTYSSEIATRYKFGIVWDIDEKNSVESLYEKFERIDYEELSSGCDEFIGKVIDDNHKFENVILRLLSGD